MTSNVDDREYQPDFDAEERGRDREPNFRLAKEHARRLLTAYKLVKPPIDLESLLRGEKLSLAYVDEDSKLSAQLYPLIPEITVNRRGRSLGRQRFSIAHELGHWKLGHHLLEELPPDTLGYSGEFEGESGSLGRSRIEIEANVFAAELLMPSAWLRKLKGSLTADQPDRLSEQYGVSRAAMFYQLMSCDVL